MEYQFPKQFQLTKEEEKKIDDVLMSFFKGLFWFIAGPMDLYNKKKKKKNGNKTNRR